MCIRDSVEGVHGPALLPRELAGVERDFVKAVPVPRYRDRLLTEVTAVDHDANVFPRGKILWDRPSETLPRRRAARRRPFDESLADPVGAYVRQCIDPN